MRKSAYRLNWTLARMRRAFSSYESFAIVSRVTAEPASEFSSLASRSVESCNGRGVSQNKKILAARILQIQASVAVRWLTSTLKNQHPPIAILNHRKTLAVCEIETMTRRIRQRLSSGGSLQIRYKSRSNDRCLVPCSAFRIRVPAAPKQRIANHASPHQRERP